MGLTAEFAEATMAELVFQSAAQLVGFAHEAAGSSVLPATALVVHQTSLAFRDRLATAVAPFCNTRIFLKIPRKP